MRKPISQKEARALRREVAGWKAAHVEHLTAKNAAEARAAKLDEENTRLAGLVAQKEKALATGVRLGASRRIATWHGSPVEVREAIRVAAHLGRVVVIEVDEAKGSYAGHPVYRNLSADEVDPPEVEQLRIFAYEKL